MNGVAPSMVTDRQTHKLTTVITPPAHALRINNHAVVHFDVYIPYVDSM